MAVYMIIEIQEIKNPETYRTYIEQVKDLVIRQGGKYLSRGAEISSLGGDWNPQRLILIEFSSLEAVQSCFNSPEYRSIAPLRENATTSRAIIVKGDVD